VPHLVAALERDYFFSDLVLKDVVDHSFGVKMGKLDWECLKGVAFGYVVFYGRLELIVRKGLAA